MMFEEEEEKEEKVKNRLNIIDYEDNKDAGDQQR